MRRFLIIMALLVLAPLGLARAEGLTDADKSDFSRIISEQIEAFQADDGARAYSYAAPMIQQVFPTAEHFMAMVCQGYMPVYRPQSFSFGQAGLDDAAFRARFSGSPVKRSRAASPIAEQMASVSGLRCPMTRSGRRRGLAP